MPEDLLIQRPMVFLFTENMDKPQKSYYAIIPANVRYDVDLAPNAKLLYGEITALCNEKGYCWASNEYFAELYGVSKVSISKWVSSLVKKGYLETRFIYKENSREIDSRILTIGAHPHKEKFNTPTKKSLIPHKEKFNTPHKEKFKDNSTLVNNTLNNSFSSSEELERRGDQPYILKAKKGKEKIPPVAPPPQNTYQLLMTIYYDWYKERVGVIPAIDGAEGKALKAMQKYFEGIARQKATEAGREADMRELSDKAVEILKYIFANWDNLEPFLCKQVKLAQISSNITNIINYLKNGRKKQTANQSKIDRSGTIAEGFASIEKAFGG